MLHESAVIPCFGKVSITYKRTPCSKYIYCFALDLEVLNFNSVLQLFVNTSAIEILFSLLVQNRNSFLLLYYLKSQIFPPQPILTCWLDSVTNIVAFDTSFLGEFVGFFGFNCNRCSFGFSLSHFTLDFSWFSLERYMKGKFLYSQMFVLPSKACKGSLVWTDFFLKSCNYSWKGKKKTKKPLSLIAFLVLLVTVFIIPFYIIFY